MSKQQNILDLKAPYLVYFGDVQGRGYAKTGLGLIKWRPNLCAGQLRLPACTIDGGIRDMSIAEAVATGVKSLVIGVAPSGGEIPSTWGDDLVQAAQAGLDVVSGMHVKLKDIPNLEFAAKESGSKLIDVRCPPAILPIGTGAPRSGMRLLAVGTDCAVGKKYTALSIEHEMRRRGWEVDFRATGQTGIMIAGRGIPIDSVVADFLSGAAEAISPSAAADHWDVIEGQGALAHPSYAGVSLGLLHGSQPDALVLCHEANRDIMLGTENKEPFKIQSLQETMELNLKHARRVNPQSRFVGLSVNTSAIPVGERKAVLAHYARETGLPTVDPIIDGASAIVDQIAKEFGPCRVA